LANLTVEVGIVRQDPSRIEQEDVEPPSLWLPIYLQQTSLPPPGLTHQALDPVTVDGAAECPGTHTEASFDTCGPGRVLEVMDPQESHLQALTAAKDSRYALPALQPLIGSQSLRKGRWHAERLLQRK